MHLLSILVITTAGLAQQSFEIASVKEVVADTDCLHCMKRKTWFHFWSS